MLEHAALDGHPIEPADVDVDPHLPSRHNAQVVPAAVQKPDESGTTDEAVEFSDGYTQTFGIAAVAAAPTLALAHCSWASSFGSAQRTPSAVQSDGVVQGYGTPLRTAEHVVRHASKAKGGRREERKGHCCVDISAITAGGARALDLT